MNEYTTSHIIERATGRKVCNAFRE